MLFTEPLFFFFFAVVFCLHWSVRGNSFRKAWLLLASYAFYAGWDWRFLSLILTSTLVDYYVGLILDKPRPRAVRRFWLIVSLIVNLGILGFFKYFNFFVTSIESALELFGIHAGGRTLHIILPVGISFYTFQTMSYTIDIYRGKLKVTRNFLDFALFVGFFPQLVAGPIVRAADFLPQLRETRLLQNIPFRKCLGLFLVGYFKKSVISDNIAALIDPVFSAPADYTALSMVIAVIYYAVQIYCDFSGYTDMAIATANLLGFRLVKNFDFPYFASNMREFWRRWHISLSTWLRDYLYISLGGNRGGTGFIYRNLMITMLLGGLWHGAGWNFVIWGAMHGVALVAVHVYEKIRGGDARGSGTRGRFIGIVLTFTWTCLAWIFFRANNLTDAVTMLKAILFFGAAGQQALDPALLLWFVSLIAAHWIAYRRYLWRWFMTIPDWLFAAIYATAIAHILPFVPMNYRPFIYFQF